MFASIVVWLSSLVLLGSVILQAEAQDSHWVTVRNKLSQKIWVYIWTDISSKEWGFPQDSSGSKLMGRLSIPEFLNIYKQY